MTKQIIQKWYNKIGFDKKYDDEFYKALESYDIDENVTIDTYNLNDYNYPKLES